MIQRAILPVMAILTIGLSLAHSNPAPSRPAASTLRAPYGAQGESESTDAANVDDSIVQRIEKLETELATTQLQLEQSNAQLALAVARLDRVSQSAANALKSLDRAESAGYTAGINFESRKILLSAWRGFFGSLKPAAPAPPEGRGARRQRATIDGRRR